MELRTKPPLLGEASSDPHSNLCCNHVPARWYAFVPRSAPRRPWVGDLAEGRFA